MPLDIFMENEVYVEALYDAELALDQSFPVTDSDEAVRDFDRRLGQRNPDMRKHYDQALGELIGKILA